MAAKPQDPTTATQGALRLASSGFTPNGEMPARYTCEGQDVSPPITWENVPANARSLALIVDDPDAPDPKAPQRTWVHWLLFNLPPEPGGLDEGVKSLPGETRVGMNDWKEARYGGPCPPIGRHRYFFKLYALDTQLGELQAPDKAELLKAMEGHVLARTELVGTYERKQKKA